MTQTTNRKSIDGLANVHNGDIDNDTGERISHREKYQRIIAALGYEAVKRCIPYTLEEIKKALPRDEHLNNLPLARWDVAAGFRIKGADAIHIGSPLNDLYRKVGIRAYSPSSGVCILKEAARMWAEE